MTITQVIIKITNTEDSKLINTIFIVEEKNNEWK